MSIHNKQMCNIVVLASEERHKRISESFYLSDFKCLTPDSFQFYEVADLIAQSQSSLVIVDLATRPLTLIGYELIRSLRASSEELIIVGLTPKFENETERIFLLTLGVDEVLSADFNSTELRLRINRIVRQNIFKERERIIQDPSGLTLYPDDFKVTFYDMNGSVVSKELSKRQFNVLSLMVKHPLRIWTRSNILDICWDEDSVFVEERLVDNIIYHIRKKIPLCRTNVKTIINTGYRYVPSDSSCTANSARASA